MCFSIIEYANRGVGRSPEVSSVFVQIVVTAVTFQGPSFDQNCAVAGGEVAGD
jgi:hypothetical protein